MLRTLSGRLIMAEIATVLLVAASTHGGPPEEEHFDIWLDVADGQVVIGAISEDGTTTVPGVRVFGSELGKDVPFATTEPGFQTVNDPGGPFAPNATLGFNILAPLSIWNGGGFDPLDPLTQETMTLAFGPAAVTTGSGAVPGFTFEADDNGGLHDHFDFFLNGPQMFADPQPGISLLELNILGVDPPVGGSLPFWIVFNNGLDEADHEAAIQWVEANLVPAPGSLVAVLLLAMAGSRRRRQ